MGRAGAVRENRMALFLFDQRIKNYQKVYS